MTQTDVIMRVCSNSNCQQKPNLNSERIKQTSITAFFCIFIVFLFPQNENIANLSANYSFIDIVV